MRACFVGAVQTRIRPPTTMPHNRLGELIGRRSLQRVNISTTLLVICIVIMNRRVQLCCLRARPNGPRPRNWRQTKTQQCAISDVPMSYILPGCPKDSSARVSPCAYALPINICKTSGLAANRTAPDTKRSWRLRHYAVLPNNGSRPKQVCRRRPHTLGRLVTVWRWRLPERARVYAQIGCAT